jgi:hypothetical protein
MAFPARRFAIGATGIVSPAALKLLLGSRNIVDSAPRSAIWWRSSGFRASLVFRDATNNAVTG